MRVLVGRAAHLAFGGALALPYAGLVWLFERTLGSGPGLVVGVLGLLAVAGGLGVALLPVVRPLAIVVVRTLLGVDLPDAGPGPAPRDARVRAAAWFAITALAGAVAVLAVLVLVPQAVGFAVLPLTGGTLRVGGEVWAPRGAAMLLGPLVALVGLALVVLVVTGLGSGLAGLAPRLLGPTPAEALAAERARAGRLAWRARLAGELHDHLGHTLTAMTLQAGAAGRVLDADPEAARRALAAIEDRGRAAVDELDRVLTLLRDPEGADPGGFGDPGDVPSLVEGIRATGREVHLVLEGEPGPEARRVVREGLTNAVRHGGTGPVEVVVRAGPTGSVVTVTNPAGVAGSATRRGHGLEGLRDRVEAVGGRLRSGPADGSWTLHAELPGEGP
ncbi:sensor histidine kinase [Actinomycetospora soli]|uniref:sensor histidine kinase n=1 Tax=Actinomycetospora soli TaxID=2893887 RepID=UPI001E3E670E|nr:histidine kinase [Actinomycetospora soli]MCD2190922.1 histidine kinase [Actinomycetospora soli]